MFYRPQGRKRVVRVREHSRTSISVMFRWTAAGVLSPSKNLCKKWTKQSPDVSIYNHGESGFFSYITFPSRTFSCIFIMWNSWKSILNLLSTSSKVDPDFLFLLVLSTVQFLWVYNYLFYWPDHSIHLLVFLQISLRCSPYINILWPSSSLDLSFFCL